MHAKIQQINGENFRGRKFYSVKWWVDRQTGELVLWWGVKGAVKEEAPAVEETAVVGETTVAEKTSATKTEEKETASGSADVNTTSTAAQETASAEEKAVETPEKSTAKEPVKVDPNKIPEDMTVEELQAAILAKMANNGPVTDQMKKTVDDNIWHDSLVNWLKSFR